MVTVASQSFVLNATNAEVIIGTVIEEANNGKIDLNGFSTFWTFVRQQVNATLGATETELQPIASACHFQSRVGLSCSGCVCDYRNKLVSNSVAEVEKVGTQSRRFGDQSVHFRISNFMKNKLNFRQK